MALSKYYVRKYWKTKNSHNFELEPIRGGDMVSGFMPDTPDNYLAGKDIRKWDTVYGAKVLAKRGKTISRAGKVLVRGRVQGSWRD